MAINDFLSEVGTDYEQKCLCVFVLDVSGYMRGKPMEELNKCLQDFNSNLSKYVPTPKLEISIITFDKIAKIIQEPTSMEYLKMPHFSATDYSSIAIEDAVNMAINLVEHRKEWYKMTGQPYSRPLIVLISSVEPDCFHNIDALAKRIKRDTTNYQYSFLPIGFDSNQMYILYQLEGDHIAINLLNLNNDLMNVLNQNNNLGFVLSNVMYYKESGMTVEQIKRAETEHILGEHFFWEFII